LDLPQQEKDATDRSQELYFLFSTIIVRASFQSSDAIISREKEKEATFASRLGSPSTTRSNRKGN